MSEASPIIPDYGAACVTGIVPALIGRPPERPEWMPTVAWEADRVVLLVLDGLGWEQLQAHRDLMPTVASMAGGSITTVCPSTTAAALTSISTGTAPGEHGVIGYRIADSGTVLNALRWRHDEGGDARRRVPADEFQPIRPFLGAAVPVITKSEFESTGFTEAHLRGGRWRPWSVPSSIVSRVRESTHDGAAFTYAYYDGIDKVAHFEGLAGAYRDELRFVDRLVAEIVEAAAPGTAVLVTADHGQLHVGDNNVVLDNSVLACTASQSGEARFRWLHARPGRAGDLLATCQDLYADVAWVVSIEQVLDEAWFGRTIGSQVRRRFGDVALVAREPVAFDEPADTGNVDLVGRHGGLTTAEMLVPLVAALSS